MWKWRGLSLYGKATIIKIVLIPKFIHVMSTMPTPTGFIKRLEKIIFKFLWNGLDKISRSASINKIKYGGLNIIDITTFKKSLRLAWLSKVFAEENNGFWRKYLKHKLHHVGEFFFFRCNYDIRDYEINNQFYKELLQWWSEFREKHSSKPLICNQII